MKDAKPEKIWTRRCWVCICRILTTAPLTHSNDACHPSVCLLVIWKWHTVACRMPSLIVAQNLNNWKRRRKNLKGASELQWPKWSTQLGLTVYEWEKGKKGAWKPTVAFSFPIVKYICLQSLRKAHKGGWQLKTCFLYVRISLCDTQGKCYFLPPTVVYGKQVSKTTSVSKAKLIKVTIWKVHAFIFDHSMLYENSKFACVILEVNFPLWSVTVQNACNTQHNKAVGFLSWICPLLNYIGTLSRTRCTPQLQFFWKILVLF